MRITCSNEVLIEKTKTLVKEERRTGLEVLHHLQEIDRRKLYTQKYPSLFEMCVHEFGYSKTCASRRIDAMRLISDFPEVEEKLQDGRLHYSTLSQVQTHFKEQEREAKRLARKMGVPQPALEESKLILKQKQELLQKIEGLSCREVEKEIRTLDPKIKPKEQVRYISSDRLSIHFSVSEKLFQDMQKLKHLMSHKNPSMNVEGLMQELVEIALNKHDPERKKVRPKPLMESFDRSLDVASGSSVPSERNIIFQAAKLSRVEGSAEEEHQQQMSFEEATSMSELEASAHGVAMSQPRSSARHPVVTSQLKKAEASQAPTASGKALATDLVSTPQPKNPTAPPAPTPHPKPSSPHHNPQPRSRHIAASTKRLVHLRDEGQCTHVDPATGRKCASRHLLQLDHILPFSQNGAHTAENLRLLCAAHNPAKGVGLRTQ